MIIVTSGTFINNALRYLDSAGNGEDVEIILPNGESLLLRLQKEEPKQPPKQLTSYDILKRYV